MKHLKSCAAAVLALLAADAASAATTINITGSTAFRGATINQIVALFDSGKYDYAYSAQKSGSADKTAAYATFVGVPSTSLPASITGNGQLIVQCAWTGSVDGIRDVVTGSAQNFIKSTVVAGDHTDTTVTATLANTPANVAVNYESVIPQITMADNRQSASIYNSVALTENKIGVVPFVWVKAKATSFADGNYVDSLGVTQNITGATALTDYNSINNITSNAIRGILGGGYVPMSYLTGKAADANYFIQAVGRYPLSGTRVIAFADSGFGATSPATSQVKTSSDATSITDISIYPAGNGYADGDNGYSGGGDLATAIKFPITSATTSLATGQMGLVGYVGLGDASTIINNYGNPLTGVVLGYNGVSLPYSVSGSTVTWDITSVQNGSYPFWFYEFISYRTNLAGKALDFANALKSKLTSVPQASLSATNALIKLDSMQVGRDSEGSVIGAPQNN
jgi:hypothetical protein